MNKREIIVPRGIRFISDWKEYRLQDYPFPHILNKVITGCGFTEYCIGNDQNLILISPRRFLLENKESQHTGDLELYYARNEIETFVDFETDVSKDHKKDFGKNPLFIDPEKERKREEEIKEQMRLAIENLKAGIRDYLFKCIFRGKKAKILITYDSFRHVKDVLIEKGILDDFQIVVDEFQSMMMDSRFKPGTEIELLYQLQDIKKVCFVSATPMLDTYLDRLDEFKNLPYLTLDWETDDPRRVSKPKLDIKFVRSLGEEITRVIQTYLKGKFEVRTFMDDKPYQVISDQAVFFMNSVKSICIAIRSNRLLPEQCNILCARTKDNTKKLRKAFGDVLHGMGKTMRRDFDPIGRIPLRGEPHNMFTFCTRTVYLGADFYSPCARSFIFSDSNIECLSVDISIDMEQILGRQRLDENPWKNTATVFIKTTKGKNKVPREEFDNRIKEKIEKTKSLLRSFNNAETVEDGQNLADLFRYSAQNRNYRYDYVGVNHHAGSGLVPVLNNLVLVSEQRAFDIQQVDYADRFTVLNTFANEELVVISDSVKEFLEKFSKITDSDLKLRALVNFYEEPEITETDIRNVLNIIPPKYKDYFDILGIDKIKSTGCQECAVKKDLERFVQNSNVSDDLASEIYQMFEVGKRYTKKDIKEGLRQIFEKIGYSGTPKAILLSQYFDLKTILTPDKQSGFEILGKKH